MFRLMILAIIPLACSAAGSPGSWEGSAADSAGVTIVSNTGHGAWTDGSGWTVERDLLIGQADGDANYLFGLISGIGVTAEGRIVVLDQQASELKVYDGDGVFLLSFGNAGSGPGELGASVGPVLLLPGDTVAVPDVLNLRVNLYTVDGAYVGSFPRDLQDGLVTQWSVSGGGRMLAQLQPLPSPGRAPDTLDALVSFDRDGTKSDPVMSMPSGKTAVMTIGEDVNTVFTAFAPEPVWTAGRSGHLFLGISDRYRIGVYDDAGELVRIVLRETEPRPLSNDDREFYRAKVGEFLAFQIPRFQFEQIVDGMRFAEYYPEFLSLWEGVNGSIWVQKVLVPSEMSDAERESFDFGAQHPQMFVGNPRLAVGAPEWDVFDRDGKFLGVIAFPERFQPTAFVGEMIFGIWRDGADVEHVMRLRVVVE